MNLISSIKFYFPVGDQSVLIHIELEYFGLVIKSFQLKSFTPPYKLMLEYGDMQKYTLYVLMIY